MESKEFIMCADEVRDREVTGSASAPPVAMKLEVVVIPVSDVDRAKEFYARLAWRLDADRVIGDNFRLVQFTPPGSGASIQFGVNLTPAPPGSARGLLLIVSDIEAARQQLAMQGVEASEIFHCESGTSCRFPGVGVRVIGPEPQRTSYSSFVSFQDPDGNGWVLQEVTKRLAGRVSGDTTFTSAQDLGEAMIRAAKAHGEDEKRISQAAPDWPYSHAAYMVREQSG
jgi:catechol 2,3-dioxygenase-like lactoylglutathione lyase family enzyme